MTFAPHLSTIYIYQLRRISEECSSELTTTMISRTPLLLLTLLLTYTTLVAAEKCIMFDKTHKVNEALTNACTCGACRVVHGSPRCSVFAPSFSHPFPPFPSPSLPQYHVRHENWLTPILTPQGTGAICCDTRHVTPLKPWLSFRAECNKCKGKAAFGPEIRNCDFYFPGCPKTVC
ncbi:hypothetical protein IWX46DRAFT_376054 [Phyllosticta citricarpa]|uniref:Uncharacterized protein n=1 Tax=Phyllosticta citricarpa TaxID=55181 RepID=A0ABR1L7A0_9PEZI